MIIHKHQDHHVFIVNQQYSVCFSRILSYANFNQYVRIKFGARFSKTLSLVDRDPPIPRRATTRVIRWVKIKVCVRSPRLKEKQNLLIYMRRWIPFRTNVLLSFLRVFLFGGIFTRRVRLLNHFGATLLMLPVRKERDLSYSRYPRIIVKRKFPIFILCLAIVFRHTHVLHSNISRWPAPRLLYCHAEKKYEGANFSLVACYSILWIVLVLELVICKRNILD